MINRPMAAVAVLCVFGLGPARGQEAPTAAPPASIREQYEAIAAEWKAAEKAFYEKLDAASGRSEDEAAKVRLAQPDLSAYCDRMIELAMSTPDAPAARDALLWVVYHPNLNAAQSPLAGRMTVAAALLVVHFGDDPDAIRVGLEIDNEISRKHDLLIEGFAGKARGHEAKGLATFAMAQYWVAKANLAEQVQAFTGLPKPEKPRLVDAIGPDGKKTKVESKPPFDDAYLAYLRSLNCYALRAEAEKMYEEVAANYGDVLFDRHRDRRIEATIRDLEAKPERTAEENESLERSKAYLARRKTLAAMAEAKLDKIRNLAPGKPAPELDAIGLDGKPVRLSDHRGQVVALVFWATWCGPCMRAIPDERALVEKMKGRPFAMIGVSVDNDPEDARRAIESERMTWPNVFDGTPGTGPLVERFRVRGYPTIFLIDAEGIIREPELPAIKEVVESQVEELVAEAERHRARGAGR